MISSSNRLELNDVSVNGFSLEATVQSFRRRNATLMLVAKPRIMMVLGCGTAAAVIIRLAENHGSHTDNTRS